MANRTPIVLGSDGLPQQVQSADTTVIPGPITVAGSATFASYGQFNALGNIGQMESIAGSGSTYYKVGLRNDSGAFYILSSSAQSSFAYATTAAFSSLRPFAYSLANGAVTIDGTGAGTTFGGAVTVGGSPVFPSKPTPMGVTTVTADATYSVTAGTTRHTVRLNANITAARTVYLNPGADGQSYRFIAINNASYSWNVGNLKNLAMNTWCDVIWDVTVGDWILSGYGSL